MSKLTKFSIFIAVATTTYVTGTLAVTLWVDSRPYISVTEMESLKKSERKWPATIRMAAEAGRRLAEWEEEQRLKRLHILRGNPQARERYEKIKDIIERSEKEGV